jgi:hypothetical protein
MTTRTIHNALMAKVPSKMKKKLCGPTKLKHPKNFFTASFMIFLLSK